ncbi:MAG: hypothetical protein RL284_2089 [Bacteroidota bacterium]
MLQFNNHVFKEILKNFQENVFGKIFEIPILKYKTQGIGSIWIPGSYFTSNLISDLSRDFPLFFMLCTNSKNPKYNGNFS